MILEQNHASPLWVGILVSTDTSIKDIHASAKTDEEASAVADESKNTLTGRQKHLGAASPTTTSSTTWVALQTHGPSESNVLHSSGNLELQMRITRGFGFGSEGAWHGLG